ncbi:unnamed protein product [Cuscuta campestris]|uniref:Uncharacterized protein n=1 Tax=Cuscuta campestris TaxID=132261 RepID=A0A484M1B1_9ASTE|nr:unnamed protein product [Cuscuta campestris]
MDLTSGFFTSSLGTVTVSTPFSMDAFTWSNFAFSGSRNRRRNLPLLRSRRCHLSSFSSFSLLLSPLICKILPSSTSTFTSSFFSPGRSALNTWLSGVSFQSIRAFANADVSLGVLTAFENGNPWKGSQKSRENGSGTWLRERPPKKLGIREILPQTKRELIRTSV